MVIVSRSTGAPRNGPSEFHQKLAYHRQQRTAEIASGSLYFTFTSRSGAAKGEPKRRRQLSPQYQKAWLASFPEDLVSQPLATTDSLAR